MKIKLLYTAFIIALFISCKKEGPQGPAGKDGKDGKDGNANVKSSTITFSNWTWNSTDMYEYADFTWSAITSSIVNSGALNIYLSTPAGWAPLPRVVYPSSSYSQSQRYVYNTGSFRIIVQDSDLTQPAALGTWTIKAVAVDASARLANPDLNWNNYEEVKKRFNLAE